MMRDALLVARKDLLVELRARRAVGVAGPFAATLLVLFGLAFGPGRAALASGAPAILWLALLFSAVLILQASFEAEAEDEAFEELVLSGADPAGVFLGKAIALAVQLLAIGAALVLGVAFLFGVVLVPGLAAAAGAVMATVGLASVGTLFAALAARARSREAMLQLLLLPLAVPILLGGIRVIEGGPDAGAWVGLLAAAASVAVAAGVLLFEHLVEP